jgi:hypothetical protein
MINKLGYGRVAIIWNSRGKNCGKIKDDFTI